MRWIAALAVALLLAGHARAQQRNAHWPIPPGSWLHFDADGNHVDPWVISSIYNYRSASISSPTGALQLHNDAYGIYNANGDTLIAEDPDSYAIGFGQAGSIARGRGIVIALPDPASSWVRLPVSAMN